ncbi:Jerky -like protein-like, partial [Trichinella zimbabwensis]
MTGDIFCRWYDETFIPHVEEYQQKTSRTGKVLLIIDNAPCHPSSELLDRKNGLFKVLFLPPNTSSLVQPMDQTVIQSLKKRYRKQLLRKIVLSEADGGDLVSQLKSISLKDCCYMIAQAWDSISGHTLRVSWNRLLGYKEECVNQSIDCDEDFATVTEMFEKFKLSQDEGEQWLADDDTPLFETLTDDEILKAVQKDENEDVDESDMPDKSDERLSHSEAYSCAKVLFNWMEQQNEFSATQLMVYFQREWLPATKIPLWNVHGVAVRTNNHLEGWHSRMNKRARETETVVRQMDDGCTRGRGSVRRSAAYGVQQRRVAAHTVPYLIILLHLYNYSTSALFIIV